MQADVQAEPGDKEVPGWDVQTGHISPPEPQTRAVPPHMPSPSSMPGCSSPLMPVLVGSGMAPIFHSYTFLIFLL